MKLYLDDDTAAALLVKLLTQAGHDVEVPADVGMAGKEDPLHLAYTIRTSRVILTRNYQDFEHLHLLVMQSQGHHPGILVIRRDDDPRRNMSPKDIVRAIHNLLAAGVPLDDQYYVLNQWQ
jgi:predicted nuclease of predicted toxin-antitoxin system